MAVAKVVDSLLLQRLLLERSGESADGIDAMADLILGVDVGSDANDALPLNIALPANDTLHNANQRAKAQAKLDKKNNTPKPPKLVLGSLEVPETFIAHGVNWSANMPQSDINAYHFNHSW